MAFVGLNSVSVTGPGQVFQFEPPKQSYFTMTSSSTGNPATATVIMEGYLDGTNWFTISYNFDVSPPTNYTYVTGDGPWNFIRLNLTALSGGTSPTITVLFIAV